MSAKTRELKIDRAVYLVDDASRAYWFARRNDDWRRLDPGDNERNKRSIEGYRRRLRCGTRKTYRRSEHP